MSQSKEKQTFDPFDPTGMLKQMRDTNLESWSKIMTDYVNTEAYAESTGAMLDAWLTTSGPFRNALESAMGQALAQMNMPTREDITRLAERLTNIEMRLDDLDARLDDQDASVNKQTTT
jgi:polyhydroxyalkanoic acid synthase PhaR subunit